MEGTRFVRAFMDSLDVQVDSEAATALREIILESLQPEDPQKPSRLLAPEEAVAIRESLAPESVLATYEIGGERKPFTAGHYLQWIEVLPSGEIRDRTIASIGRALRNEVLAERGMSLGLHEHEEVRQEVAHRAALYLSGALRHRLRVEADVEMTDGELREAFEQMGFRKLEWAEADFWQIEFETLEEAESARDAIASDSVTAASFETYESRMAAELREMDELGTYIQRAPMNAPVVIGTGDGSWFVVEVTRRDMRYSTLEGSRDEIAEKAGPYVPEVRLVRELRKEAEIEIDRELFEEMMALGGAEDRE
jgi:hypothetical protein